jgi:glycosyltransferase involved in cell wall biosynthesis
MTDGKKKLFQLTQNYGTSIAAVCNEYSRSLDRNEYHITVAFLTGAADPAVEKEIVADRVIFLEMKKRELRGLRLRAMHRIVQLFKTEPYHVVVCHRYKAAQVMALVRLFCDIPLLFFVIHAYGYMNGIRRKLYTYLFMRKHFRFIAVSEAIRRDLLQSQLFLPPEGVITIHNTLPAEAAIAEQIDHRSAREELGCRSTDFVFGTVGRLVSWKNHENLIRAFALASPKMMDAKLVIVGDGKQGKDLKQLVGDLALDERVILTGAIPKAHRLMKAFDVFVLPSDNEPFGIVLLEAMAAQVPIISSDSGAPPEIVGSFAMMVSGPEPQPYADKMIHAFSLAEDERKGMGARGFRQLQERFSDSRFGEMLRAFSDAGQDPRE